jgi:signal transduction histidine kinase
MAQAEIQAQTIAQSELAADRRRFLQRLDHELKNPLTAIRAGVANLSDAPDVARHDAVSSISTQAARLSQLVSDLRKLAELETRPIETAAVDVSDLLQEVVVAGREQPDAAERRLGLTLPRVPWPLGSVQGDRDLLFLAVYNLLDNALKFTRPGDTIELRAFEDGANVAIEVADTGPGIPDEDLPHIWEELYRGRPTRALPGSGLGLALVRSIAARHNGTVTARSRPGHGTVFTLRLPAG